jgi:hypothetical protein
MCPFFTFTHVRQTCFAYNFFLCIILQLSQRIQNQREFLRFLIPILIFYFKFFFYLFYFFANRNIGNETSQSFAQLYFRVVQVNEVLAVSFLWILPTLI